MYHFSTMQNTESGRKLNQAMASTGRAVATTGKAVGELLHDLSMIDIYTETPGSLKRKSERERSTFLILFASVTCIASLLLQGGALSQAKGAFSNWWTTLTTVQPVDETKIDNQTANIHHTSVTDKDSVEDGEINVPAAHNADITVGLD